MAAKVAYKEYDKTLEYLRLQTTILKEIGDYCAEKLNRSKIRVHAPQGGFYLFPDFSFHQEKLNNNGINTSNKLCSQLLKDTGVVLLPASAFGFEQDYLAARLAYVDFQQPTDALFDIEVDCPNVTQGIDKICNWILNL